MKKRKNTAKQSQRQDTGQLELKDRLDKKSIEKLKHASKMVEQQEKQEKEVERQRKIAERKEQEKNKTFEQLFEESNLDWKTFK
ncbi:YqkE family protein [Bacillus sp. FJAT-45350]|uniref:YqkE family protein n=1 Tax=Bacillus sp. FJAT-45350 TaxID=2011014 RepID=UPI000BB9A979|nr:YqkE family protein [Bacillus sp. FJAT-45350]